MTEWVRGNQLEQRGADGDLGGTMRLGAYPAILERGSKIAAIYGTTTKSRSATATATRSTSTTATGWSSTACASPACRRTASCRRRSNIADHPVVHRRAVPPRAEVAPLRPAPAVRLHRGGGGAEPAGADLYPVARALSSLPRDTMHFRLVPAQRRKCGWLDPPSMTRTSCCGRSSRRGRSAGLSIPSRSAERTRHRERRRGDRERGAIGTGCGHELNSSGSAPFDQACCGGGRDHCPTLAGRDRRLSRRNSAPLRAVHAPADRP